jgi:hypothetical protein
VLALQPRMPEATREGTRRSTSVSLARGDGAQDGTRIVSDAHGQAAISASLLLAVVSAGVLSEFTGDERAATARVLIALVYGPKVVVLSVSVVASVVWDSCERPAIVRCSPSWSPPLA